MQLLETLGESGAVVMVKPGVLVAAFAPMKFDTEGNLIDQETRELLAQHLAQFAKWTERNTAEFVPFACEMGIQLAVA